MHALDIVPLDHIPDIAAGDDLAAHLSGALAAAGGLVEGDILVIAQKIVSKAEGRAIALAEVKPSARALELAAKTGKDPRLVELILGESIKIMRAVPGVLIVRHRLGHVMANAGIDQSNISAEGGKALLLPEDPDQSARHVRERLRTRFACAPGVIVSDSFGRAWRKGSVNVAIGVAGLAPLVDRRGERDRYGRIMEATEVAVADALAAAAGLVMGEGNEGRPAARIRGVHASSDSKAGVGALIRAREEDLFR